MILPSMPSLYELLAVRVNAEHLHGMRTDYTRATETVDDDRLATLALLSSELPQ